MAPERRRSRISREPARQHQPDAAAMLRELERSLQEKLISIWMGPKLDLVDTGIADEPRQLTRILAPLAAQRAFAAVAPDHVPRRITDDGIETGIRSRTSFGIEEHFGKFQRPVQKPAPLRDCADAIGPPPAHVWWQHSVSLKHSVQQLTKDRRRWRHTIVPEPAGAPEVQR